MGCFGGGVSDEQKTQEANQTADRATRDKLAGQEDNTLGYFMGKDPTQTGLYKSMLTGGIQATNNAYDNAKAANRLHSRVAGFGYEQPLTQASDQGVELGRAGQLSDVPREALLSTIGPELQATGLKGQEAGMYSQGGIAAGNDATTLDKQRMASQSALLSSLIGGAVGIGKMFLPGAGMLPSGPTNGTESVSMDQLNSGMY